MSGVSPGPEFAHELVAVEELSYEAAAQSLGVPVGTVRSGLSRAGGRVAVRCGRQPGRARPSRRRNCPRRLVCVGRRPGRPDPTGGVAAQFMFDDAAGQRLTLFVRRTPAGADTAFRYVRQDGIGSFYWIDRGFGYALSGELPRDAMLSVATAVHRQINP